MAPVQTANACAHLSAVRGRGREAKAPGALGSRAGEKEEEVAGAADETGAPRRGIPNPFARNVILYARALAAVQLFASAV